MKITIFWGEKKVVRRGAFFYIFKKFFNVWLHGQ